MKELAKLQTLFEKGKITRREFIAGISALGLTATLSPLLKSTAAAAAVPKKGGRFRQAMSTGSTTDSLDPMKTGGNMVHCIRWQVSNSLVEIDHNGNAIPELAESFEPSIDAMKWVFNIRKGVEFNNGKSLDADDVQDTLNLHRAKDSTSAFKPYLKPVKEIKSDGKYQVIITLNEPNIDFPYIFADFNLGIAPAGTRGKDWEKGIGTGGYILQEWKPGIKALTRRNPNYWKEGRAHFDEIETINIKDENARVNALKSNAVDFIARPDLKSIRLLEKSPDIQIISVTSPRHSTMPMTVDTPPFDNNDVRLALKYAVDREQMVKLLLRGYGKVGNDNPIGPTYKYHNPEIPQREYDPDKAKYHLKKAGLEKHSFTIQAPEMLKFSDAAILFKEHAAKAGINIEVKKIPNDGYWSDAWLKAPFRFCLWNGRPNEDMMFTAAYLGGAPWNENRWNNPRFNKLLKESRAELNEEKRREMYYEMQRLIHDEGGNIVYMLEDNVDAANKNIKFNKIAGNYPSDGLRNSERWWFEL